MTMNGAKTFDMIQMGIIFARLEQGEITSLSYLELQDIADCMEESGTRFTHQGTAFTALHASAARWAGHENVLGEHTLTRKPLLAIYALHPGFQLQKAA